MKKALVLLFLCSVVVCTVAVQPRTRIGERPLAPDGWKVTGEAPRRTSVSFWVALKQSYPDAVLKLLDEVSDPRSLNWRKYPAQEDIDALVAPSEEALAVVMKWLESAGAAVRVRSYVDALEVQCPVELAEQLFQCQMMEYSKQWTGGRDDLPVDSRVIKPRGAYSVPTDVAAHIDFVSVLDDFPFHSRLNFHHQSSEEQQAAGNNYVSPDQTRMVSQIPKALKVSNPSITQGAVEFGLVIPHETGQDGGGGGGFQFSDLQIFAAQTNETFINVSRILGPFKELTGDGTLESLLDVQYLAHTGNGAATDYSTYLVWMYEFAVKLYADPNAPLVNSISYGTGEYLMCNKTLNGSPNKGCALLGVDAGGYIKRANVEFAKLGLRGITLVSASGDNGAPSENNKQCEHDGDEYPLFPVFPAGSPYVLAVGGVAIITEYEGSGGPQPEICQRSGGFCGSTPYRLEASMVTNGGITTGGGFSNYSARLGYQDAAVEAFLASGAFKPPSTVFKSGNRAYPDVAHLASNILIMHDGDVAKGSGTSASTPMIAGFLSLINAHLASMGEAPVGFVNPLVYQMAAEDPSTFIDITTGNNTCTEARCCKYGYAATKGWDPVTGFGVPLYPKVIQYINGLLPGTTLPPATHPPRMLQRWTHAYG